MNNIYESFITQLTSGLPQIINAYIIFFVGFLVSIPVKKACLVVLDKIRLHSLMSRTGLTYFFDRVDIKINPSNLIATTIQSFVIVLSLMLAADVVGLHVIAQLLERILLYYPNIFISFFLFFIGAYGIDISQKMVVSTVTFQKISYSRFVGKCIDWSIRILVTLAIIYELRIIPQLIFVIFAGVTLTLSLAVGISFGLAAKKPMEKVLEDMGKLFQK
jgi:hypothetical protein